ncbi:unnamed protein product [Rodentolepis nana]|uniref:SDP_N domain-containing protein n=1 Tax=Rodentolepis nana TaxID=102285 RepID=A0A0R3TEP2_RODNA|nr:unnamed protein product [Rodentolepis nana]
MVPPPGRFRSFRRRSRSPLGVSVRPFPSSRHGPRQFKYNGGPPDIRPKFRDQPFNNKRDIPPRRNLIIQNERGPNFNGPYSSRNRSPVNDRPSFDAVERRPPPINGAPRRFNRNSTPPQSNNSFRNFNGGRDFIKVPRRDVVPDRNRRFMDRGDHQSYRSEVRHHFDNQTMRDAPRRIRSPLERDHWRSDNVNPRRSPIRHKSPRLNNITPPTRYTNPYVDDVRRFRGGHRGGRTFRSGRALLRSQDRSLPSRR